MATPKKASAKTKAAKEEKPEVISETKKETTQQPNVIPHVVSEQDVINNPDAGLTAGETVEITSANENEFEDPDTSKEPGTQLSFAEAELAMDTGSLIKLPKWGGFWFKDITSGKTYVLTKEGEIVDNLEEEHKESNEWEIAEPTSEQEILLSDFFEKLNSELPRASDLKVIGFNRRKGGQFEKIKKQISFEQLTNREGLPGEVNRDSEILLSDGSVYDYEKQQITQQKASL